ncbi:hypothetical protein V8C26DRAFT_74963 [Trichoderma gracile]
MPHGLRASRHMYIYSVPAVCLRFLIRARGIALLVPVSLLVPVPKLAIAGGSASGPRSVVCLPTQSLKLSTIDKPLFAHFPLSLNLTLANIYPSPPRGTSLSPLALFRLAYQRDPNPYFLARIITAATLLLLSTIGVVSFGVDPRPSDQERGVARAEEQKKRKGKLNKRDPRWEHMRCTAQDNTWDTLPTYLDSDLRIERPAAISLLPVTRGVSLPSIRLQHGTQHTAHSTQHTAHSTQHTAHSICT